MKHITRNKAAEIIGVRPQTITNWVKQGLLGGYKDEKGYQYVSEHDVLAYADKYKMLAIEECVLDKRIEEINILRQELNAEYDELRNTLYHGAKSVTCSRIAEFTQALYTSLYNPKLKPREVEILKLYLIDNTSLDDISEMYELSKSRIIQIIQKTCCKASEGIAKVNSVIVDCLNYDSTIIAQRKRIEEQQKELNEYKTKFNNCLNPKMTEFLERKLDSFGLSTRAVHTMCRWCSDNFYELRVGTLQEFLLSCESTSKLKRTRSCGKTTMEEIKCFMNKHGLVFKDSCERDVDYFSRLNKSFKE